MENQNQYNVCISQMPQRTLTLLGVANCWFRWKIRLPERSDAVSVHQLQSTRLLSLASPYHWSLGVAKNCLMSWGKEAVYFSNGEIKRSVHTTLMQSFTIGREKHRKPHSIFKVYKQKNYTDYILQYTNSCITKFMLFKFFEIQLRKFR